ncbi:MAG: hypothetical protein C4334_06995 [Pyrinomonas sp.]|mgnify:CR=1 FL=1|uniref:2Fe-2S iron-sulfur cluster-binding protein n=1 Tax=Pyrinomonas sp. TaxID=2080306 RepID=UPI0033188331
MSTNQSNMSQTASNSAHAFDSFLHAQSEQVWADALRQLLPRVHEVDRNATQIWFHFFPLSLARALERADDPDRLAREMQLQGRYRLHDQIDDSHRFLYGHRFWPTVKAAVTEFADRFSPKEVPCSLAEQIGQVAREAAQRLRVEESLVLGITAVAFMTVRQVGLELFRRAPGKIMLSEQARKRTPDEVLRARARDDRQGLLGFLRTEDKRWTVTFDENDPEARFKLVHTQEIAWGAALDKRPWHLRDPRCVEGEGPIPVQCRSAACGTCWVGVLGGAEKLSEVSKLERRMMPRFGYIDTDDPRPLIRLSCQAKVYGAVSIVIPPWNGYFGKFVRDDRDDADDGMAS